MMNHQKPGQWGRTFLLHNTGNTTVEEWGGAKARLVMNTTSLKDIERSIAQACSLINTYLYL